MYMYSDCRAHPRSFAAKLKSPTSPVISSIVARVPSLYSIRYATGYSGPCSATAASISARLGKRQE